MSTSDAVARETAWLISHGDQLPALLTANGGPWDVIEGYLPRTPQARKSQVYVLRRRLATERFAQQRRLSTHHFSLTCYWPIGGTTIGTNIAENEQQAFDNALALLVTRIEAYVSDKTHGGRFFSVAESPNGTHVQVEYVDPVQTMGSGFFQAAVTYVADDPEYID